MECKFNFDNISKLSFKSLDDLLVQDPHLVNEVEQEIQAIYGKSVSYYVEQLSQMSKLVEELAQNETLLKFQQKCQSTFNDCAAIALSSLKLQYVIENKSPELQKEKSTIIMNSLTQCRDEAIKFRDDFSCLNYDSIRMCELITESFNNSKLLPKTIRSLQEVKEILENTQPFFKNTSAHCEGLRESAEDCKYYYAHSLPNKKLEDLSEELKYSVIQWAALGKICAIGKDAKHYSNVKVD